MLRIKQWAPELLYWIQNLSILFFSLIALSLKCPLKFLNPRLQVTFLDQWFCYNITKIYDNLLIVWPVNCQKIVHVFELSNHSFPELKALPSDYYFFLTNHKSKTQRYLIRYLIWNERMLENVWQLIIEQISFMSTDLSINQRLRTMHKSPYDERTGNSSKSSRWRTSNMWTQTHFGLINNWESKSLSIILLSVN